MPSSPISRASAILVMSPRLPRFQSVMPIRNGSGAGVAPCSVARRGATARREEPNAACFTSSRRVIRIYEAPLVSGGDGDSGVQHEATKLTRTNGEKPLAAIGSPPRVARRGNREIHRYKQHVIPSCLYRGSHDCRRGRPKAAHGEPLIHPSILP